MACTLTLCNIKLNAQRIMQRIHIVVNAEEKSRFRRSAQRQGQSLSEWLRDAARQRLSALDARPALDSMDALDAFFAGCDQIERGREPDWEDQRKLIERSIRSGIGEL